MHSTAYLHGKIRPRYLLMAHCAAKGLASALLLKGAARHHPLPWAPTCESIFLGKLDMLHLYLTPTLAFFAIPYVLLNMYRYQNSVLAYITNIVVRTVKKERRTTEESPDDFMG